MRAPVKEYPPITAWSYSRYSCHAQCPLKLRYRAIDKLKVEQTDAQSNGVDVHALGERYLKAPKKPKDIPVPFARFAQELEELRDQKALSEHEIVFTEGWKGLSTWWAKDAWLRVKIDALVVQGSFAYVVDFKTGKLREEHADQTGFYALNVFKAMPRVKKITTGLWYLDHPQQEKQKLHNPTIYDYTRKDDYGHLDELWKARAQILLNERIYPAKPNFLCGWCEYSKDNGGPCQFGK